MLFNFLDCPVWFVGLPAFCKAGDKFPSEHSGCGRESGVRNLKKLLEKIYRKVAFKLVKRQGNDAQPGGVQAPPADSLASSSMATSSGGFVMETVF